MDSWIAELVLGWGYWGIALLMFLENVIPPIPSEIIMGLAGIAAGRGDLNLWLVILVGTIGSTAGNYFWFLIGRYCGILRLRGLVDRYGRWVTLEWEDVEQANALFLRYGGWIIFAFRFLPMFRTIISLPAGMFGMGHIRFLVWTAAGGAIWNTMLALAGFWLGANYTRIEDWIEPVGTASVALFVGIYLYRIITWKPRARRTE